jgi:hypothetical protein
MIPQDSPPQQTSELWRILAIPRRTYSDLEQQQIAKGMTDLLRRPGGQGELWTTQGTALFDLSFAGGLVAPIPVGMGKTLISLLAPTVWKRTRPLLLVPAALVDKTKRAFRELSQHWKIVPSIRIWSYQWLGTVGAKDALKHWAPDIIVCDEAHYIANTSAGVTRRLKRYLEGNPECVFAAMSGTLQKRSLWDFAHIVKWAFRRTPQHCPIPLTFADLEAWASVLDEKTGQDRGTIPDIGALSLLVGPHAIDPTVQDVRLAFGRRFSETLGVVAANGGDGVCAASLTIATPTLTPPPEISQALAQMRADWATPDGVEFLDAISLWRHCRELALGFYYRWTTQPPELWRMARKEWAAISRWIIEHGRKHVDTVQDAANSIDRGEYPEFVPYLERWRAVEPDFEPETEAVWLSNHMLDWVNEDVSDRVTLYWVEHRAMGEALARRTGLDFYAPICERTKRSILDHPKRTSAIVSWNACRTGFDLPWASRNVIVSPPTNARAWEQLLGRTHRKGQLADEVNVIVPVWCPEHRNAIDQAVADAHCNRDMMGSTQKLLLADWADPNI